jgi:Fanconi anemia group M protein
MTEYISHKLLKPNTVERRLYQEVIVAQIEEKGNTLVVAPTALGKTVVAALLSARMLEKHPEKKILFLAPTKPLAVQHQTRMREFLKILPESVSVLTGALSPEKRAEIWNESTIIAATPQTIENDILTGKMNLNDVQLVIFDEAHRAVKEYAYVFLAQKYMQAHTAHKHILALTASPGSTEEEVQDICKNLYIQNIVVKTLEDADVKPYLNDIHVEWRKVKLPNEFHDIKHQFQLFLHEQLNFFKKIGYARNMHASYIRRQDLLELQVRLRQDMMQYGPTKPQLYQAVSKAAAVLKVTHAITLLESQGIHALHTYLDKMKHASKQTGSPKAAKLIAEHPAIIQALKLTQAMTANSTEHPKMKELATILTEQFATTPESRVLVFNHYRESVSTVTDMLNQQEGIRAARFIGQANKSDTDKGLSQKEQIALLEDFGKGKYNVLVASSVAEEGLDIPSVDLVVFYEPVPSEIRLIQRRGRTGRKNAGKVIILMAEKTMDEAMYYASKRKEKNMHETLRRLSSIPSAVHTTPSASAHASHAQNTDGKQSTLGVFGSAPEKIYVFADTREQASPVMRELSFYPDVNVQTKVLEVGDFVVGPDVVIERKTIEDFLQSLIDGRLMGQLVNMSQAYARPVVLLEGNPADLFTLRNVHENAIIGMMSTIAVSYRIPILFTKDAKESAKFVYSIAKKEQLGKTSEIRLRMGRKGLALHEQQRFLVEGLPNIGPGAALELLKHFGTIQNIMNADAKELQEVANIGPKKASALHKVIRSKYDPQTKHVQMDAQELVEALEDPTLEEEKTLTPPSLKKEDAEDVAFD